jgi:hypothetical protein
MTPTAVERIESASALRRGVEIWYATLGGAAVWMGHLVFVAAVEHWTHLHVRYGWTVHVATVVCVLATALAIWLAWRLYRAAAGGDPAASDDTGQLLFLAQLALLVNAISLALILLEGSYALFIPRG